ncbi:MAG: hypothetical protein ACYC0V_21080 [Armatimonadota bacterium]
MPHKSTQILHARAPDVTLHVMTILFMGCYRIYILLGRISSINRELFVLSDSRSELYRRECHWTPSFDTSAYGGHSGLAGSTLMRSGDLLNVEKYTFQYLFS